MRERNLDEATPLGIPVLDELAPGARGLAHPRIGRAIAHHEDEQFAAVCSRQDFGVEKRTQLTDRDTTNGRTRHV